VTKCGHATLRSLARCLSPELRDLIYRYCPSVKALTILLHIQAHPHRAWTPRDLHDVASEIEEEKVADLLAAFYAQKLLVVVGGGTYRYEPDSSEVAGLVALLAKTYADHPAVVLEEIMTLDRGATLRSFADAFILKKDSRRG
jgi:hypothetical protein